MRFAKHKKKKKKKRKTNKIKLMYSSSQSKYCLGTVYKHFYPAAIGGLIQPVPHERLGGDTK